jgi:hypothetical protein
MQKGKVDTNTQRAGSLLEVLKEFNGNKNGHITIQRDDVGSSHI